MQQPSFVEESLHPLNNLCCPFPTLQHPFCGEAARSMHRHSDPSLGCHLSLCFSSTHPPRIHSWNQLLELEAKHLCLLAASNNAAVSLGPSNANVASFIEFPQEGFFKKILPKGLLYVAE